MMPIYHSKSTGTGPAVGASGDSISKPGFIFSTLLFIVFLFLLGHMGLVSLYSWGMVPTQVAGGILVILIIALFTSQKRHRFFPLTAGFLLWAVLGEISEHVGIGDIVNIKNGLLLFSLVVFVFYLVYKNLLPEFPAIAIVFFFTIWASHFVMISLFEQLSKTHTVTYISSLIFLVLFIYALYMMARSARQLALTIVVVFLACSFWSIMEYLWAWKFIPKPW